MTAANLLTKSERQSHVWVKLMDHLKVRLESLRTQNDGPKDPVDTANLRGRIAEIKSLILMDKEPNLPD